MPRLPWSRAGSPLLAVLAGLFLFAAFPPLDLWPAAFFGVGLLSWLSARSSLLRSSLLAYLAGLAFFLPLLEWTDVVGVVPWVLLCMLQAAFFVPLGLLLRLAASRPLPLALLGSVGAWVLSEAARSRLPWGGFPWGRLGVSQPDSPLLSWAALGGIPFVSAAVVVVGVSAALLVSRRLSVRPRLVLVGLVLVPFAAPLVVPEVPVSSRSVEVAAVQGGVPEYGLPEVVRRREVLSRHVEATERYAAEVAAGVRPRPEVVLWPENASDADPFVDPDAAALVSRGHGALKVPLLFGAVVAGDDPGTVRNLVVRWGRSGPLVSYQKQHPVPFGEYLPYRPLVGRFFGAGDLVPRDFVAGDSPGLFPLPGRSGPFTVGSLICFEVAYDPLVRVTARGSDFVVVATNNATFGMSAESPQQLDFSRLRAVESGRAVVVVATSGISAVVFPDGSVVSSLGIGEVGVLSAALPVPAGDPLALRWGGLVELVLVLFAAGALPWSRTRQKAL